MTEPAIIFDFGNVIGYFDHGRAYARFGARLGLDAQAMRHKLHGQGFRNLLVDFECGRIEPAEFAHAACACAGIELPFAEFERDWADIFWPNESIVPVVHALKAQGRALVLGSNTNRTHADWFRNQFAHTLDQFDALVLSCDVGVMKPHRAFYEACAQAAGLPPGRCVFIDDVPENVQGAHDAGLHALLYTDTPNLLVQLEQMGVPLHNLAG